jgi:hypothetical protein
MKFQSDATVSDLILPMDERRISNDEIDLEPYSLI